jgi:CubicO group peptidase (beta-lactamase class C family)
MILVDQGRLGLNRPGQEYIPEFRGEWKEQVMVRHLLTHTAGLVGDDRVFARVSQRAAKNSNNTSQSSAGPNPFAQAAHYLPELIADEPLVCPPGQEMSYSGLGTVLLGEVVERVASQTLATFAHEQLFAPLGMHDTLFGFPERTPNRIVRRAPDQKAAHLFGRPDFPHQLDAPSGVCSTAWDMAIFGQMLLNGGGYGDVRVLSPASVAEMTRNQIPGIPARSQSGLFAKGTWGLGIFFGMKGTKAALRYPTLDSSATFSHAGAGGTYWWVDPVYDLVGSYFSVTPTHDPNLMEKWNTDLFVNTITAAVEHS